MVLYLAKVVPLEWMEHDIKMHLFFLWLCVHWDIIPLLTVGLGILFTGYWNNIANEQFTPIDTVCM